MQNLKKTSKRSTKRSASKSVKGNEGWVTRHKIVVAAIVTIIILISIDISPFGGNLRFYSKWIECGRKPVAENISISFGAKPRSYIEPPSFVPLRFGQPTYFCTPLEAEKAGYSANPNQYEFPHLK